MSPSLNAPPEEAISVGDHRIYLERPDLLVFVANGDIAFDDIQRTHEVIAAFERDKDYIFLLVDVSQFGSIPADARKLASRPEATQRMRALAVYGATFSQRVLILLVVKAFGLLKGRDAPKCDLFDTEAQARAWLTGQRKALLGRSQAACSIE